LYNISLCANDAHSRQCLANLMVNAMLRMSITAGLVNRGTALARAR